jgi:hypothetical protein
LDEQPDLEKAGGSVVLVPNQDASHLSFYVTTLMQDFATRLLGQLESAVVNDELAPFYATPVDVGRAADDVAKLRKRKGARGSKLKGDAALLLGSPDDALTWYATAVSENKSANELVWHAAALEGLAAATVTRQTRFAAEPVADATWHVVVERCRDAIALYRRRPELLMLEVIARRGRCACALTYDEQVELSVRVVRALSGTCEREFGCELLRDLHVLTGSTDMTPRNRTLLELALADLHTRFAHRRHAAMHARAAASSALASAQPHTALALLLGAASACQTPLDVATRALSIHTSASSASASRIGGGRRRRALAIDDTLSDAAVAAARVALRSAPAPQRLMSPLRFGWLAIQKAILTDVRSRARVCVLPSRIAHCLKRAVAVRCGAALQCGACGCGSDGGTATAHRTAAAGGVAAQTARRVARARRLDARAGTDRARTVRALCNADTETCAQIAVRDDALGALAAPLNVVDLVGLPIVERLEPLPLPEQLVPVPRAAAAKEKDIFIFSPFNAAARQTAAVTSAPTLVLHAPLVVRALLSNPLAVPLDVDSIQLSTCGVACDALAAAVSLPAHAVAVPVLLRAYVRGVRSIGAAAATVTAATAATAAVDTAATAAAATGAVTDDVVVLRGCHVRVCGVRCEQLVSPFGNGVAPDTFARIAPDIYERMPPNVLTR